MDKVQGNCPMGCGETLFLGEEGHITCSWIKCPDPGAVDTILSTKETEHIVVITDTGFSVKHPLRERVEDDLFSCTLWSDLSGLSGPPAKPGRYRVTKHEPDGYSESYRGDAIPWDFEELTT